MKKTVFISGTDKGLGRALTKLFAENGFVVYAGTFRSDTEYSDIQSKWGDQIQPISLDVSSMSGIKIAISEVMQKTEHLDVLVNNSGIYLENHESTAETEDFADGRLEQSMAVNAYGPTRLIQQALPLLRKGSIKRILTLSSEAGSIGQCPRNGELAYCISKTAVNMACKIWQNLLGGEGFNLVNFHPGWLQTDMGGPTATVSPYESAQGIYHWGIEQDWPLNDLTYLDYQGNPQLW